jgi:hypothetical protein
LPSKIVCTRPVKPIALTSGYNRMTINLKNILTCLTLTLAVAACTQHPSPETNAAIRYSGQFDLSRLLLNENIVKLTAAQGIRHEKSLAADNTLLGLEVLKSTDPKACVLAVRCLRAKQIPIPITYGFTTGNTVIAWLFMT